MGLTQQHLCKFLPEDQKRENINGSGAFAYTNIPAILVLAHEYDLLKTGSTSATYQLAINRVQTVLERELNKRRQSHAGRVAMDEFGAKGEDSTEFGGLDYTGRPGESFNLRIGRAETLTL